MRSAFLIVAVVALGCDPKVEEPPAPVDTFPEVMRNCELSSGVICPWAGDGHNGFNGASADQAMLDAWFSFPMSVTFSPYGAPVIADWNNHKLRLVQEDGKIRTIMGSDFLGDGDPAQLDRTPEGAPGTTVSLNHPTQQDYLPDGMLISASWHTHKLRTWDPETGLVHVLVGAGAGFTGNESESADDCLLNQPSRAHISKLNPDEVFILDMRNERVRVLDLEAWTVTTLAGTGEKSYCGDGGLATEACFNFPKNANPEPGGDVAESADGKWLYVLDTESHIVRRIDRETGLIELFAGSPGETGDVDGVAEAARFHFPVTLAINADGSTLYVADANNHKVRAINTETRAVSTFAGTGEPSCEVAGSVVIPNYCDDQALGGDGGLAVEARLYRPMGVDVDLDGNVVIADTYNHRFRIVQP